MSTALLLLAIGFLHYVPAFGARKGLWGITCRSFDDQLAAESEVRTLAALHVLRRGLRKRVIRIGSAIVASQGT
jgi:hypothetical protein